jgi:hypothetical protein
MVIRLPLRLRAPKTTRYTVQNKVFQLLLLVATQAIRR